MGEKTNAGDQNRELTQIENLYRNFNELLTKYESTITSPEFAEPEANSMGQLVGKLNTHKQASYDEIENLVETLKKLDPKNYNARLLRILEENKSYPKAKIGETFFKVIIELINK